MPDTGVYAIQNVVNQKVYIGSASVSMVRRFREHRTGLERGKHPNKYLQRAWNKYGSDKFIFWVLEWCDPWECLIREQDWLDVVRPYKKLVGYNGSPTAVNNLGFVFSAASRAKLSASKKGQKLSKEAIEKRTAKQKGLKRTTETKRRMSMVARTSERRKEASDRRKGVPRSDVVREKIRLSNLGKSPSEEIRKKLSEGQKKRYARPEEREKASQRARRRPCRKKTLSQQLEVLESLLKRVRCGKDRK